MSVKEYVLVARHVYDDMVEKIANLNKHILEHVQTRSPVLETNHDLCVDVHDKEIISGDLNDSTLISNTREILHNNDISHDGAIHDTLTGLGIKEDNQAKNTPVHVNKADSGKIGLKINKPLKKKKKKINKTIDLDTLHDTWLSYK